MPRPSLQVGQTFGRWLVIAPAGHDRHRNRKWRVRCDHCGHEVVTLAQYLRPAATRRGCEGCREAAIWAPNREVIA